MNPMTNKTRDERKVLTIVLHNFIVDYKESI